METVWTEELLLQCCWNKRFAKEMVAASPFPDFDSAVESARHIWFNKIDVNGWLEAFAAHPPIGGTSSSISQWSKEEQSAAAVTANDSALRELAEWNAQYKEKFGFVFLICATGRSTQEILAELKKRYLNRPIVELEVAALEKMKIIELRLARLFKFDPSTKAGDRIRVIGAHLAATPLVSADKSLETRSGSHRSRPPITTHVLDVARGCPASGMEVQLEKWKGAGQFPLFAKSSQSTEWVIVGSSMTDADGRSGPLMEILDHIAPGFYRIQFNTGKYAPSGFFPFVSIVFEIKANQTSEHFHVPLLYSPFSFTTYRGS